ncbi:MAG: glutaredoxin family protein [Burkholderiales bacterium]|nr:glutaredoxin family protein [Burkholderiales bacterium]MCW5574549.1 glutaredoxin family protein [Burkholderiales bacterium]
MTDRARRRMFLSLLAGWASFPAAAAGLADYNERRVVMYATSWCPYCQQARNYFRQQGIPYVEHDIEKDAAARRDYRAFGGRGVPVIFVDKRRMNGFSISGFEKIYR